MASTAIGPERPTVYAQRSAGYGTLALIAAALYDGRTTALVRTTSTLRALDVAMLTSDVDAWMWSEALASQRCSAGGPPRAWTETVRASSDKAVYALTASADAAAPVLRAIVGQASELPLFPPTTHVRRARARASRRRARHAGTRRSVTMPRVPSRWASRPPPAQRARSTLRPRRAPPPRSSRCARPTAPCFAHLRCRRSRWRPSPSGTATPMSTRVCSSARPARSPRVPSSRAGATRAARLSARGAGGSSSDRARARAAARVRPRSPQCPRSA